MSLRWADLSRMHPVRFIDKPWLVANRLNLLIGEEKIGKSSLQRWYAARNTRGDLDTGNPHVLVIGTDEDDFDTTTLPALYKMGADTTKVALFEPHRTDKFDLDGLNNDLSGQSFGLVLIEHILDVVPPLKNPNDPYEVRQKSMGLRRAFSVNKTTAIANQHFNKAEGGTFRQRSQSSVQYMALARASMAIGWHPTVPGRRAVVLGSANYTAHRPARSFRIDEETFVHAGEAYEIGLVSDVQEEEALTLQAVLDAREDGGKPRQERVRDTLGDAILSLRDGLQLQSHIEGDAIANGGGVALSDIARALGRPPSDGTVRNTLESLADRGLMWREAGRGGRWHFGLPSTNGTAAREAIHDEEDE